MKKAILSLAVIGLLSIGVNVSANTVCGDSKLSNATTTYVACDGGNPELLRGAWGMTNSEVPHVLPGQTVKDEGGFQSLCPTGISTYCVDVTHTDWYRTQMIEVGRQLKAFGNSGGIFGYWISLAK